MRKLTARRGKKGQEELKERRRRGAGLEERSTATGRFVRASCESSCHLRGRARLILLPAQTRGPVTLLDRFRA